MGFHRFRTLLRLAAPTAAAWLAVVPADAGALPTPSVGLSTVDAVAVQNSLVNGSWGPQEHERFGYAVATGDWNGDGADDLALGIPYDRGQFGGDPFIGSVRVLYGTPGTGLDMSQVPKVLRMQPHQVDALFGASLAAGDFNGDQFDDLAVGAPSYSLVEEEDEENGLVVIHYGGASGLAETSDDWIVHADASGVDWFGQVLAVGDFNGDFNDDLAIGVPNASRPSGVGNVQGGVVRIYHGPAPEADPGSEISQLEPLIPGSFEELDQFGAALAVGNFNGDQRCGEFGCAPLDDLAIGVPLEDSWSGRVLVLFGSSFSLLFDSALWYGEGQVGGTPAAGNRFASSLAAGDFDGDQADDLLVGAPGTTFSGLEEVGQVTVLFGSSTFVNGSWFDLNSTRRLHQGVYNGGGGHGDGDAFGAALAAGDFDFDGYDDAVIGHPGEDILVGGEHRGGFSVLTGSPANPHGPGRSFRFFGAGYAGVPLPAADDDRFGSVFATGDFNADAHADLVVGVPLHDHPTLGQAVGAAVVLYGALFADGLEWNGSLLFWDVTP